MRIKIPRSGDERVITKFLWFPVKINNEIRWLETVNIKQVYLTYYDVFKWRNVEFIDEKQELKFY